MRPRASQVARIRLVDTEEDVETYRPVLDGVKATIMDRQAELARLEGEQSADAMEARRRLGGGLRRHRRCTDQTPLTLSGGRWREHGVGSDLTYTTLTVR